MPVRLLRFANAADAPASALVPWLASDAAEAWKHPEPTLIVAPSPAALGLARHWALHQPARGTAQVHFCTVADLDRRLQAADPGGPATWDRADLELALGAALAADPGGDPAVRAFAGDPAPLAAWLEEAAAAGCQDDTRALPPALAACVRSVLDLGRASRTVLPGTRHHLWAGQTQAPRLFRSVFVFGFHAAHLPLWPLLQAAVARSHSATVCLAEPRTAAEALDQLWIGVWEVAFGDAEPAEPAATERPLATLAERVENPERADAPPLPDDAPLTLRVGTTTEGEARVVAAQALEWLGAGAPRVGVLFPGRGPLSREVSRWLDQWGVAHADFLGHWTPDRSDAWRLWLRFQANPQSSLLAALAEAAAPPDVSAGAVLDVLSRAQNRLPLRDVGALRDGLSTGDASNRATVDWVRSLDLLPESASAAEQLEATERALSALGWSDLLPEIRRAAERRVLQLPLPVPRTAWLRWLDATVPAFRRGRSPAGSHPFARVQLLRYDDAQGLPWSHLILTSLNESVWPAPSQPRALRDPGWVARRNASARLTGRQGEGHATLRPGCGHLITEAEQRRLARRQLADLLDATEVAVAATLHRQDDSPAAAALHAGSYFFQLHHARTGLVPDDAALDGLLADTLAWLQPAPPATSTAAVPPPDIAAVRAAYDCRRDASAPFGPWEFAFDAAPPDCPPAAADAWQQLVNSPAVFWLKRYAGVTPRRDPNDDLSRLWIGIRVHQWLGAALCRWLGIAPRDWHPIRRSNDDPAALVQAAAAEDYHRTMNRLARHGHTTPLGWESLHREAEHLALQLLAQWREHFETLGATHAASEWTLPRGLEYITPAGLTLPLAGRADFAVCRVADAAASPPHGEVWLVDFKTGSSAKVGLSRLNGLQLAAYGLAAHTLGADPLTLHLLKPDGAEPAKGLTLHDLAAAGAVWDELARTLASGRFGMQEKLRARFAKTTLPLATLGIDPDLLAEKWALTHPGWER